MNMKFMMELTDPPCGSTGAARAAELESEGGIGKADGLSGVAVIAD